MSPRLFLHSDSIVSPLFHSPRRLDGLSGSAGRLFPPSSTSMDDWLILASSELVTSVSRRGNSVFAFYGSTSSRRVSNLLRLIEEFSVNPISSSIHLASFPGPLIVPYFSRTWRDVPNEAAPALPPGSMGFPWRPVSGLLVPSLSRVFFSGGLEWPSCVKEYPSLFPVQEVSFLSDASDVGCRPS